MMKMENEINVTVPLEVVKASEIEPKEVKWLWYPYIPFGKVTLLQGDPGDGKSKLMLSIAALLSKGEALPFTDEEVEPIDLLSFLCLFKKDWQKQSYLALGGVGEKALLRFLSDRPNIKTVYLCLDSDQAGSDACSRLAEFVPEGLTVHRLVPLYKDWNEVLQHRAEIADGKYIREAYQRQFSACLSNLYRPFPLDILHSFFPCCLCPERQQTARFPGTAYRSCSVCRSNCAYWNCTYGSQQN